MATTNGHKASKKDDLIAFQRYRLVHRIGCGTFGTVLMGIDLQNGSEVAMKLELKSKHYGRLSHEYRIYESLRHEVGFPKVLWFGSQGDYHILVMDLLGPSLEDLFSFCERRFSLKTVLLLADQLISRLETLHKLGIIHRDVKADNFVMGLSSKQNLVHVIDMGLSKSVILPTYPKIHIPFTKGRAFCGTIRFASLNAHRGYELSFRDDLISLAYTLVYFLKGELPWCKYKTETKEKYYEQTTQLKSQMSAQQLCAGCPEEFARFLKWCYSLGFGEMPDYEQMRQLFWTLFLKKKYVFDNVFDWNLYRPEREEA